MARKTTKTKKAAQTSDAPVSKYPLVVDVYGEPYMPYVFSRVQPPMEATNGIIQIERYRVRVDRIEEPVEVLRDRLKKLWRTDERNSHHWDAFLREAVRLGMCTDWASFCKEFPINEHGIERKKAR